MIESEESSPQPEFLLQHIHHIIIGSSVIGPLHVISNTPCQDACAFEVSPSGSGVIAIADGLGSASKSEIGARTAVETAVNAVRELVSRKINEEIDLSDMAKAAILSSRKALEEKADELKCKLRDLACTIIVAVIHKDNVVVAHVGDGAVIAKTNEGLKLLSSPEDSEYANEVSPLTGNDWELSLRISQKTSNNIGIMAFTDGCQRAALRKTQEGLTPYSAFCEPLFSYANDVIDGEKAEEDIRELLLSKKVCENSDDDKTLVIAVLRRPVGNNNP